MDSIENEINRKRPPAQERGAQRISLILDAAASIIIDSDIEHLTVQKLSKVAQTSMGSLYHFFPNLQSVILALFERHNENIRKMVDELEAMQEGRDSGTAENFIEYLFSPYANYIVKHPDYIPVLKSQGFTFGKSRYLEFMKKMMCCRYPAWSDERITRETDFLHITATGILQQSFQRDKVLAYELIPRILRVLELYLIHTENREPIELRWKIQEECK